MSLSFLEPTLQLFKAAFAGKNLRHSSECSDMIILGDQVFYAMRYKFTDSGGEEVSSGK